MCAHIMTCLMHTYIRPYKFLRFATSCRPQALARPESALPRPRHRDASAASTCTSSCAWLPRFASQGRALSAIARSSCTSTARRQTNCSHLQSVKASMGQGLRQPPSKALRGRAGGRRSAASAAHSARSERSKPPHNCLQLRGVVHSSSSSHRQQQQQRHSRRRISPQRRMQRRRPSG